MPGLPQNTFDASRESRASSNTSVLVSLMPKGSPGPVVPAHPMAAQFAGEIPVPFGPVMFKMLTQVMGIDGGRNVSGSEMNVKTFQVHSKSRSPLKAPPPIQVFAAPVKPADGPLTTPKPGVPQVLKELWVNSL